MLTPQHNVVTVAERGWTGLKNGALLREADGYFDVLITADQHMQFQQSFSGLRISLIVLPTNHLRLIEGAVPALLQSLDRVQSGQHVVMDFEGDPARWPQLRMQQIVEEGNVIRYVFRAEA